MSTLRVLLIETDGEEAGSISAVLAEADHSVLAVSGFEEASEALSVQKWDAVLLPNAQWTDSLARFAAEMRQMEQTGVGTRTPLLSVAGPGLLSSNTGFDAILTEPFEAVRFAETVESCSQLSPESAFSNEKTAASLPVFEPESFAEQVGFDRDLTVEIIDLFLEERSEQMLQMVEALAADDLTQLSRAAHTIKGSFGSLHAPRARFHAHELEMAAKQADRDGCLHLLPAVEQDLEDLVPELLRLRNP